MSLDGSIRSFESDGVPPAHAPGAPGAPDAPRVPGNPGAPGAPPAAGAHGQNILVIGSDARVGGNRELGGGQADDVGRSDTTILLHVHADRRRAVAVSIPRDTLVDLPPCRLPDGTWTEPVESAVFNEAFSVGGTPEGNPSCTQHTVERLSGLRVDHTLVIDFEGLAALTQAVGGVRVCVPEDVYERDLNPGLRAPGALLFARGEQTVSGRAALDYVRLRHGLGDGSDIGRIKRQHAFLKSLLRKIHGDGLTPSRLLPLTRAVLDSMTVDPGLASVEDLFGFALSLRDLAPRRTEFTTLPWRYEGERVAVVEPEASALWARLAADRLPDLPDKDTDRGDDGPCPDDLTYG
ncbi:LCP family protein [Streptomyces sp. NPDC047072]|uniref:LCP family protein n=1 Tax=Streptomyces sp. NPDC047072 TaxID=3154809 RepID=UPI0033E370BA